MRQLPLLLTAVLIAVTLPLAFVSCGESDPKVLTDAATEAIQGRDFKAGLAGFESALTHMDAGHSQYMRAALGRCVALAHVDAARGKDEFLKLANAEKSRLAPADVHFVVSEYVKERQFGLAADIMAGAQAIFPKSKELQEIGNHVADAALKAGDKAATSRLEGLGYVGTGK
jgi:hypothetical protein